MPSIVVQASHVQTVFENFMERFSSHFIWLAASIRVFRVEIRRKKTFNFAREELWFDCIARTSYPPSLLAILLWWLASTYQPSTGSHNRIANYWNANRFLLPHPNVQANRAETLTNYCCTEWAAQKRTDHTIVCRPVAQKMENRKYANRGDGRPFFMVWILFARSTKCALVYGWQLGVALRVQMLQGHQITECARPDMRQFRHERKAQICKFR